MLARDVIYTSRAYFYMVISYLGQTLLPIDYCRRICNACTDTLYHLLYVFVGHDGNKIDKVWQQISWNGTKFCR